jgi:hypothetical protein
LTSLSLSKTSRTYHSCFSKFFEKWGCHQCNRPQNHLGIHEKHHSWSVEKRQVHLGFLKGERTSRQGHEVGCSLSSLLNMPNRKLLPRGGWRINFWLCWQVLIKFLTDQSIKIKKPNFKALLHLLEPNDKYPKWHKPVWCTYKLIVSIFCMLCFTSKICKLQLKWWQNLFKIISLKSKHGYWKQSNKVNISSATWRFSW